MRLLVRLQMLAHERERGQTMAEYVVVLGIISVTILLALGALSGAHRRGSSAGSATGV